MRSHFPGREGSCRGGSRTAPASDARRTAPAVRIVAGLVLLFVVVACGARPTTTSTLAPATVAGDPVGTAALDGLQTSPLAAATATAVPAAGKAPLALVVLHTNDNWGETEPCG